jgi:hypothetical protein
MFHGRNTIFSRSYKQDIFVIALALGYNLLHCSQRLVQCLFDDIFCVDLLLPICQYYVNSPQGRSSASDLDGAHGSGSGRPRSLLGAVPAIFFFLKRVLSGLTWTCVTAAPLLSSLPSPPSGNGAPPLLHPASIYHHLPPPFFPLRYSTPPSSFLRPPTEYRPDSSSLRPHTIRQGIGDAMTERW